MERRNTQTKEAVLKILTKAGKALSRDAIEEKITIPINRATVYRVLNQFCEDGITHKVIAEDGKQYFAASTDHNEKSLSKPHFHFRCEQCGSIECLPVSVNFSAPKGYKVKSLNCIVSGICKNCSN